MINPPVKAKRLLLFCFLTGLLIFYIQHYRNAGLSSHSTTSIFGYDVPNYKAVRAEALGTELTEKGAGDYEPLDEIQELLLNSPVVIFSKSYCPHSRFVKNLLKDTYKMNPPPTVKELDLDPHGSIIQDALLDISGRRTVPNVFVGGKSLGGGDEMRMLHGKGVLATEFKKKGGRKFSIEKGRD
ncbi:thioredoxin-like protein [Myxozyma melibiosi]|uniref:Thioredoxin-like protein n=1 Tax=Myxozyma melibiosi TaxID=54550 RepID=A0ABR1FAG1_9ASCO